MQKKKRKEDGEERNQRLVQESRVIGWTAITSNGVIDVSEKSSWFCFGNRLFFITGPNHSFAPIVFGFVVCFLLFEAARVGVSLSLTDCARLCLSDYTQYEYFRVLVFFCFLFKSS